MDPDSKEWERAANALARIFCPGIYPCAKCGYPVADGYCCNRCGDSDPKEPARAEGEE